MSLRWLPNALCVARMLLAPLVAWLLLCGEYRLTLGVFFIAAVTDALDGYLAKRFNWTSELGKILDPLADKILLVTVFIVLAILGRVPTWLAVLVVMRDVVIAAGAICFRVVYGYLEGAPTVISKINTLVQIVYVLAVVAAAAFEVPPQVIVVSLLWLTVVTTLASGVDYVITYSRHAAAASRKQKNSR